MKYIHNNTLHFKYLKFKSRLDKAIRSGSFSRYTYRKRQMLLKRLERLQKQIEQLGNKRKLALASTMVLASLTFNKPDVHAQATADEFIVNIQTAGSQQQGAIAMDDDGDFVIAWQSNDQDGDGNGIYAQRYNATGLALGREFLVNTYTTGDQLNPSIAMDADGDFIIAWQSEDQDGDGNGIYAQRFNASAVAQGDEFLVNTHTTSNQENPSIAMDGDGDFVITWQSYDQDGDNDGIYAQRFNSLGIVNSDEFQVNTYTTSSQRNPSIAMDGDGDFVIAWTSSDGQDGSDDGVYAQRYNSLGEFQGDEFQVNTYTTGNQNSPAVAMDSDGDFAIAWESGPQDGDSAGIYAQRYDASGNPIEDEIHVNTFEVSFVNSEYISNPSIAMDGEGDFVVAWDIDVQDGSGSGIYAQRFDSLGDKIDSEFLVNTYTTSFQSTPSTAMDLLGDFVIAWSSSGQDGSGSGIYAQRYEVDSAPILGLIEEQAAVEGVTLSLGISVTNDEGQTMIYSLDATSVAEGMEIDADGVFSWEPSQTQAGDHTVTVTVSDGVLDDSQTFTISVNDTPVLAAIGDQSAIALSELTFAAETTDVVGDVAYSLDASSVVKGMEIDDDGSFSWTPSSLQIGEHVVTVSVSDGTLEDSEIFTITVNDTPVLEFIGDQSAVALSELIFTAEAATDLVGDDFGYSLDTDSNAKGMVIDSSTGVFSWIPDETQVGGHSVTVTVSDGSLENSETFTITVADAPIVLDVTDQAVGLDIKLYPNPSQSVLYLKSNQQNKLTGFSIMSLSGKLIETGDFTNASPQISVEGLPVGVYILEVYSNDMAHKLRFVKES